MQLRGVLRPESAFKYYVEPVMVTLQYAEIQKDPFSEPQEAAVLFDFKGEEKSAYVPLFIVDEKSQTVKAALLGEEDNKILVSFPPTNFGHTKFMLDEESIRAIAVES